MDGNYCHPPRSEGAAVKQIPRCARDDTVLSSTMPKPDKRVDADIAKAPDLAKYR